MSSLRDAALSLIETLDRLGIHYAIGGSFAGSYRGIAGATQDLDLVVELPTNRVRDFYQAVSPQFYADEETIVDAIRRGLSFNVIHFDSGFKFDLFVAARRPAGETALVSGRWRGVGEAVERSREFVRSQAQSPACVTNLLFR